MTAAAIKVSPHSTDCYKSIIIKPFYSIFNYSDTFPRKHNILWYVSTLILTALCLLLQDICNYVHYLLYLYEVEYRTGSISEIIQCDRIPRVATNKRNRGIRGQGQNKVKSIYDSFSRKKKNIRRIINSNITGSDSFVTLTFADNLTNETEAKVLLSNFIERLQYRYNNKGFTRFLWAAERQNRGAIHFHIIFFGCPYIKHQHLKTIWGHGIVHIRQIDDKDNAGSYFCVYLSKDNTIEGRSWDTSRNLKTYETIRRDAHSNIEAKDILFAPKPIETKYHGIRRIIFAKNGGNSNVY